MGTPKGTKVAAHESARDNGVDALRLALTAAERRAATLAELTALMSEGRNALELAQRAVELTARATRAAGAYVFLWDSEDDRLVLRVATEGRQRKHVGAIRLRLGEGVTGWSALMRQAVHVPTDPTKDPRFRPFPELHESNFKSMVAVPIFAPGEEVLGVFSLYGETEQAFRDTDVSLATEVGALLASGLVQAQTLSKLHVQSRAARFLHDLPGDAWSSLQRCLHAMADHCATDLDADVCTLEVRTDSTLAHSSVHAVALSAAFAEEHPALARTGEQQKATLAQTMAALDLPRLRIPLGVVAPIGALTVHRARRFTTDDEVLLEAIGAQAAAGALSLIGAESLRPVRDRLLGAPDAESTENLLLGIGWKRRSTTPVVVQVHSNPDGPDTTEDGVRRLMCEKLAETGRRLELLGDSGSYLMLVETPDGPSRALLLTRLTELAARPGVRISAGCGPAVTSLREAHRAIRQASNACQWALLAGGPDSRIVRFEDVAHLRLLPDTALDMSDSLRRLLGMLGSVVSYDLENSTDLAQTLEAFFAHSGSVAKAADALFIHRNTLRQRIQRIEELIGQSPESLDDWILAGLAARLVRRSRAELLERDTPRAIVDCPHGVATSGRTCCGSTTACVLPPQTGSS